MLHADEDEPRFFASGDHLDRATERCARQLEKGRRILRDSQRVGAYGPDSVPVETTQALAETTECRQRTVLARGVEELVFVQTRTETNGVSQRVERIDLVPYDTGDLAVERVAAEIDGGERGELSHALADPRCVVRAYASIGKERASEYGHLVFPQVPMMPPSSLRMTTVAERGRPPPGPSGHVLTA